MALARPYNFVFFVLIIVSFVLVADADVDSQLLVTGNKRPLRYQFDEAPKELQVDPTGLLRKRLKDSINQKLLAGSKTPSDLSEKTRNDKEGDFIVATKQQTRPLRHQFNEAPEGMISDPKGYLAHQLKIRINQKLEIQDDKTSLGVPRSDSNPELTSVKKVSRPSWYFDETRNGKKNNSFSIPSKVLKEKMKQNFRAKQKV